MATANAVAPVIIKRKKVVGGGGHHGGAWKVAYADFVTAMMAFFMLMWLLNATTEKQRKGIADYFNPTIPINRISGGGDGAFGGDSIFSENTLAKSGTGSSGTKEPWVVAKELAAKQSGGSSEAEELLETLNATLVGGGGESDLLENAMKHVVSRISDEGVVIEIFDLPERALFDTKGRPMPVLDDLIRQITKVALGSKNSIAIKSHVRTEPIVRANTDPWRETMQRSLTVRRNLALAGIDQSRFDRITGNADTHLVEADPLSVRNNRIEFVFLIEE
ncbi:MAG: flagellar motor protein MotB [Planktotalea sp.]|uniref:flagellar motor protein MotB n=1 Tax=Planktotalea sp. TaxID=2029877 RepID=UPI003C765EA1